MSTPSEYEELIEGLLKLSMRSDGYDDITTYRLRKYRGKSGHEHVIDVSFQLTIAGLKFLVLVECKQYRRKVGVDDVMEFAYRVRDIGAHKGVIVTTCGFQDGAIAVAKSEGIGLLIAARGKLSIYMGAQYTVWKYWLESLFFKLDRDAQALILFPRRITVGNHLARVSAIDSNNSAEVVFVLPYDLPEPSVSFFAMPDGESVIELIGQRCSSEEISKGQRRVLPDREPIA